MNLLTYSRGSHVYKGQLALRLSQTKERSHRAERSQDAELSFSAASFLANLLYASNEAYPSGRAAVDQVLDEAGSTVSLRDLENRSLVQFTLGRLYLPAGIWTARFVKSEPTRTPEPTEPDARVPSPLTEAVDLPWVEPTRLVSRLTPEEQAALRILVITFKERRKFSHWISLESLIQIHSVHKAAHVDTPDLEELLPLTLLTPSQRGGCDGYYFSLQQLSIKGILASVIDRSLAQVWGMLRRDAACISSAEKLQRWWTMAGEPESWNNPVEHMSGAAKNEFLDACCSAILEEFRPTGPTKEWERISWEFRLHEASVENIPASPPPGAHLLDWHQWYYAPHFLDHRVDPTHTDLDDLVRLVVSNETHDSAHRSLALLAAAVEKPYLLYPIEGTLKYAGRSVLPAVINNWPTSALGIKLIQKIPIGESELAKWEGIEFREREHEENQTRLWRDAIHAFLASEFATPGAGARGIEELSRILLIASKASLRGTSHAPDSRAEGAERRWRLLLELLEGLGDADMRLLVPALIQHFVGLAQGLEPQRPQFSSLPLSELRVMFWLMTTNLRLSGTVTADTERIAESILRLYSKELQREIADSNRIISWIDDVPDTLLLPWADLAEVLQISGNLGGLLGPSGIDWEGGIAAIPERGQVVRKGGVRDESGLLYLAWLRKLRLHLRVLLSIHRALNSDLTFRSASTSHQKKLLLEGLRDRIRRLTIAFSAADPKTGRPSLFHFDFETPLIRFNSSPAQPPILDALIDEVRRFPLEQSDDLLEGWIEVENDPRILLTLLSKGLPPKVSTAAGDRLEKQDLEEFLDARLWIYELMQLAEKANLMGKVDWVERILARGGEKLSGRTLHEWDKFAFRMRLMIAYHRAEPDRIEKEPLPVWLANASSSGNPDHAELEDSRRFYLGLVHLKDNPRTSHAIFKDLAKKDPLVAAYTINAFAARVGIARQIEDPEEQRADLRRTWTEFANAGAQLSAKAADSTPFVYSKLLCLDAAGLNDEFDAEWARLGSERKHQIDFLSLGVANARRRMQGDRATEMLAQAQLFNRTKSGSFTDEFQRLMEHASLSLEPQPATRLDLHEPDDARSAYLRWIAGPAHILARIFGEAQRIDEFLWHHLLAAAREFLNRRTIFQALKKENDRNDALCTLMRRSLAYLRWEVGDQSRGGWSGVGKDAGARDWIVRDGSGELAIIEALNLDSVDKTSINDHIERLVVKYDSEFKEYSFLVIYYEGKNFATFWNGYVAYVTARPLVDGVKLKDQADPITGQRFGNIRALLLLYEIDGIQKFVWHLAMNLGPKATSKSVTA